MGIDAKAELIYGFEVNCEDGKYEHIVEDLQNCVDNKDYDKFLYLFHQYDECTRLFVFIGPKFYTSWGSDLIVESINTPHHAFVIAAQILCKEYDIPFEKPKWHLIAGMY